MVSASKDSLKNTNIQNIHSDFETSQVLPEPTEHAKTFVSVRVCLEAGSPKSRPQAKGLNARGFPRKGSK